MKVKNEKTLIGQCIIAYGQKAKVISIEKRKLIKGQKNDIYIMYLDHPICTPDTLYTRDFIFTMEIEYVLINNEQFN